jgi:Fe-S-cluster containining protein
VPDFIVILNRDGAHAVSDEFLCVRCARHQQTCCQDSDIHVSLADVRRIAAASGRDHFTEFRQPAYAVYDQRTEDPFWYTHVFRQDGMRRVLKQRPDGDCGFLGQQGCTLPTDARPLVCRLYPYDYNAEGILERPASGCPVELLLPGQKLLEELQMSAEHAEQLRNQLYQEIAEPGSNGDQVLG